CRTLWRDLTSQRLGILKLQSKRDARDTTDHDVAFGNRPAIERRAGDSERGRIYRVGVDDRADFGMSLVDRAVNARGAARRHARFGLALTNQNQIVSLQRAPILLIGRDQKAVAVQSRGE